MIETLVLADDLTGALECGSFQASAGADTIAVLWPCSMPARQVVVVDLETRHAPPDIAGRRVLEMTSAARNSRACRVYLKIDSTLRGPIGAHLDALLAAWPAKPIIYAPAYPRMGRVVRAGCLFVNGKLQAYSIPEVLRAQCSAQVICVAGAEKLRSRLRDPSADIYVCDAETQADLGSISRVVLEENASELCAGPGGFFSELIQASGGRLDNEKDLRANTGLIVNGSVNPVSLEQTAAVERSGFRVLQLSSNGDVSENDWVVLTTSSEVMPPETTAARIVDRVNSALKSRWFESLTIFGGDTAYHVLRALGVETVQPLRELLPGIPASRIRVNSRDLLLITKAGGFGAPDTITQIRDALVGRG
jgi:D-threonate/D-erythronate kinase